MRHRLLLCALALACTLGPPWLLSSSSVVRLAPQPREASSPLAGAPLDGARGRAPGAASSPNASAAGLAPQRLPACMVGFFVHVDKTGGTSVRSLLQAQAAHGEFDVRARRRAPWLPAVLRCSLLPC